jgi:hypothetical protein
MKGGLSPERRLMLRSARKGDSFDPEAAERAGGY